jgi:hypothetical protein
MFPQAEVCGGSSQWQFLNHKGFLRKITACLSILDEINAKSRRLAGFLKAM